MQNEKKIKALQKPNNDRGDQYHRKRAFQKILRFIPQKMPHVDEAGQAVIGKLHDKWYGFPAEQGLFE